MILTSFWESQCPVVRCPLCSFTSTHNILYNMQITGTQEIRDRPPFFFNVVVLPFLLTHTWLVKYFQNTGIIFWFVYRMRALFQTHQIHFLKGEMFQLKLMGDDCLFPAAHKSGNFKYHKVGIGNTVFVAMWIMPLAKGMIHITSGGITRVVAALEGKPLLLGNGRSFAQFLASIIQNIGLLDFVCMASLLVNSASTALP